MIAFDNGPANGDYVRYIDDLMREAAASAAANVQRNADASAAGSGWTGGTDAPGRRAMQESTRTTGFTAPLAVTSASTTAAAIASALMSGQVGPSLRSLRTKLALAAIALGAIAAGAGLLWQPLSLPFVIGGIALVAWAVRTLKDGATTAKRSDG